MLNPESPLKSFLAEIKEKCGPQLSLVIYDDGYGAIQNVQEFGTKYIFSFTSINQLCDFLNKQK